MFIYHVTYAISKGVKLLRIVFNDANSYIKDYDRTKYLPLFPLEEKQERTFDKVGYHINLENNFSNIHYNKCMKTKINSDDNLSLEKHYICAL